MHILQKCHRWFSSQPSLRNTKLTAFYIVIYSQLHKYTISDTSWKFLITNDWAETKVSSKLLPLQNGEFLSLNFELIYPWVLLYLSN